MLKSGAPTNRIAAFLVFPTPAPRLLLVVASAGLHGSEPSARTAAPAASDAREDANGGSNYWQGRRGAVPSERHYWRHAGEGEPGSGGGWGEVLPGKERKIEILFSGEIIQYIYGVYLTTSADYPSR